MNREERDRKLEVMTSRDKRLVQVISVSLSQHSDFGDEAYVRRHFFVSSVLEYTRQRVIDKNREWTFSNKPFVILTRNRRLSLYRGVRSVPEMQ